MNDSADFQAEGTSSVQEHKAALNALSLPSDEKVTFHMVHLSHLDLMWYWGLADTVEMCLDTVRWHVEMLEAHPDARYSHTQVFILFVVEQVSPRIFERFARLVREGRAEVDSGQWVEPDHNLPTGESIVRQFLYGQLFLQNRFGVRARTVVNSDSFGHCSSLPQIAKQAGIRRMIIKRPRQLYVDLPESPFLWRGIDGTEIPVLRFINKGRGLPSLSQYYDLPNGVNELQEKVNRNLAVGVHHLFGSHCNSDAGGVYPYVRPLSGPSWELKYSTPSEFWDAVEAEGAKLPIVSKPLNYIYQGCYTTHILEKQNCRRAERELRELELLWTLAAIYGHAYPAEDIAYYWRRLCFLQFHDILAGTGSPEVHADSAALYQEMFTQVLLLRRKAQVALDYHSNAVSHLRQISVANIRPYWSDGVVAADVDLRIDHSQPRSPCIPLSGWLEDEDGNRTAYQIVDRRDRQRFVHGTMLFRARKVPPLAVKHYHFFVSEEPVESKVKAVGQNIENELLLVEIGGGGIIQSIVSKRDGREWLSSPVRIELWPETEYRGDYGSPMKAWFLGVTDAHEDATAVGEPEVIENGPVRATIRLRHKWGASLFTTDVSLYAEEDWVEVRVQIDWREKEVLARLCVEPRVSGRVERRFGIPFGYDSATGEEVEVPAVGWASLSGEDGGFAVLNLDRPGHTFRDGCIRTSMVRCATGDWDPCTDSGIIHATLRLVPFAGIWAEANVPGRSDEFHCPMVGWQNEPSNGTGRRIASPITIEGEGLVLSAFKPAEDLSGYIVRVYESLGKNQAAVLTLGEHLSECSLYLSNVLEDQLEPLVLRTGAAQLDFAPFEIKTILIKQRRRIASLDGSLCARKLGLV